MAHSRDRSLITTLLLLIGAGLGPASGSLLLSRRLGSGAVGSLSAASAGHRRDEEEDAMASTTKPDVFVPQNSVDQTVPMPPDVDGDPYSGPVWISNTPPHSTSG